MVCMYVVHISYLNKSLQRGYTSATDLDEGWQTDRINGISSLLDCPIYTQRRNTFALTMAETGSANVRLHRHFTSGDVLSTP